MFFDSHAHLNDPQFADDLPEVLAAAKENGIAKIAVVGFDWESSKQAVALARQYREIYGIVGVHPHDADGFCDETEESLRTWAKEDKVVAIGEIGLDYYRDLSPRAIQQIVFRRQLAIARDLDLPFSIHSRDAMEDVLKILKEEKQGAYQGILHCYSGSYEQARILLDLGFHISFAGPVTYPNSKKLPEIAAKIPLERILIETDCPYLSPQPRRGKRNEPANVRFVAEKIAEIRGIPVEAVAEATYKNACRLFRIDD